MLGLAVKIVADILQASVHETICGGVMNCGSKHARNPQDTIVCCIGAVSCAMCWLCFICHPCMARAHKSTSTCMHSHCNARATIYTPHRHFGHNKGVFQPGSCCASRRAHHVKSAPLKMYTCRALCFQHSGGRLWTLESRTERISRDTIYMMQVLWDANQGYSQQIHR